MSDQVTERGDGRAAAPAPGPEAPAIVALLARRWKPKPAAAAATLLDLATRGHLHLVAEPSGQWLCRPPSQAPSEPLAPFEQQLLQCVAGRLSGDRTPAAALLPDPGDDDGRRWYATFKSAVVDEARRLGLVRPRLPTHLCWGLAAAATVPAAALGLWLFGLSNSSQPVLFAVSPVAWGLLMAGTVMGGPRGTAAGRAAASRWLEVRAALLTAAPHGQIPEAGASPGDRMLAWAVALDAAPDVLGAVAPPERGRVWSSAGGRWRQVRVSGRSEGSVPRWPRRRPDVVAQDRTFTGTVIRRWRTTEGDGTTSYTIYHLAVDDGRTDEALAWRVRNREYERFKSGSTVRVAVDHKGRLAEITASTGENDGDPAPLPAAVQAPIPKTVAAANVSAVEGAPARTPAGFADLVPAGFWRRAGAGWVDTVLLTVALVALSLTVLFVYAVGIAMASPSNDVNISDAQTTQILIVTLVLQLAVSWLYSALLVSSSWQATLGKRLLGLQVTDVRGRRVSFSRATARHAARMLVLPTLSCGFLMMVLTERRQALHDVMAGTLVVGRRRASGQDPGVHRPAVMAALGPAQVQHALDGAYLMGQGRLPPEMHAKVADIRLKVMLLMPRIGSFPAGSDDVFRLQRIAVDYLPTAIEAYLALPYGYATTCVLRGGKTALQVLGDQLDQLDWKLDEIGDAVRQRDTDRLLAHGRFLDESLGRRANELGLPPSVALHAARREDGDEPPGRP
jgi:uncharacterized RDD family membrane protein YckC